MEFIRRAGLLDERARAGGAGTVVMDLESPISTGSGKGEWRSGVRMFESFVNRVCVYRATGPADAYLVRDHLVAHGLKVEIRGELLGGLSGALPTMDTWPALWVLDRHAERARELISQWDAAQLPDGPEWVCVCGAEVDAHFGECWKCGRPRP